MPLLGRIQALGSRRLAACAAAFGVIALTTALTVAPASAGVIETAPLHNYDTNLCLDSNSSSNVYALGCLENDSYQEWKAWDNGNLGTGLQDLQTDLCLDSNNAGAVYTSGCNANDAYQEWSFGGEGLGYTIQDVQTGLCLDGNSAGNIYTSPCNWNNWYQNWLW
jgi:hypothetical protein